jgi:catalase
LCSKRKFPGFLSTAVVSVSFYFTVEVIMVLLRSTLLLAASLGVVSANGCPYGHSAGHAETETLEKRADQAGQQSIMSQFTVSDENAFLTSDAGGPITDQNSLTAGEGGPTLLEDFIFRQKITHFDHERVSA